MNEPLLPHLYIKNHHLKKAKAEDQKRSKNKGAPDHKTVLLHSDCICYVGMLLISSQAAFPILGSGEKKT